MGTGKYQFTVHSQAEARTRSAIVLIKLLLQKTLDVIPEHRKELLNIALWKLTEAEGMHKHRTRFCSEAALSASKKDLRHDHVFQRSLMIHSLMTSSREEVDCILAKAVACTITHYEHTLLNEHKRLDGWKRYEAAGIKVIDMSQTSEAHGRPNKAGAGAGVSVPLCCYARPVKQITTLSRDPDPRDTVKIIDLLVEKRILDEPTFRRMHHLEGSISNFRRYCSKIKAFQQNSPNRRLHEELQRMLESATQGKTD